MNKAWRTRQLYMLEVVLRGGGCWQSHRSPGVFIAFCVAEGCIVTFIALVHMVDATPAFCGMPPLVSQAFGAE